MRLNDPATTDDLARPAGTDTPPPLTRSSRTNVPRVVPEVPELKLTVVEARHNWNAEDVREVWRFRELMYFLTLRDIKIRYKQTILGVGWSLLQPLATVLVFAVFLGSMGEGVENYTLFVLCGVLPWLYFANATTNAANSLIGNERLVTRTYFPRILLPASNVGAATFDFLVAMVVLAVWLVVEGPAPTWRLLLVPPLVALVGLTALGFGAMLSGLIAVQRDFRYLLTFGMQLWMFCTPCIYRPLSGLGPAMQQWLPLNPLYGLVLNFRACLLGEAIQWPALAVSSSVAALILAAGLIYFRRVENTMADTI